MSNISPLSALMILWGIITAVLAVLLIYRSLVSMKEEDQLFLDPAQSNLEKEQQEVRKRLDRLTPYTKILSATSGLLLISSAGVWVYQQLTRTDLLR